MTTTLLRRLEMLTCAAVLGGVFTIAACGSGASKSGTAGSGGGGAGTTGAAGDVGGGGSGGSNSSAGGTTSPAGGSTGTSSGGSTGTAGAGGTGGTPSLGAGGMALTQVDAGAPPAGCPASALQILFKPMYSAFDGVHTFQVPAVVNGLDPTEVQIDWSASDPTMVALQLDPSTGGVMITTQKAGTTMIFAQAGSLCGASLLTISAATPQDWMDGSQRYNSGVVITRLGMTRVMSDAGVQAECTSCHGSTASAGPFKTVQHTPEQTGGFSDDDLINIFQNGIVPKGGYFDPTIVSYAQWQGFHKWNVGDSAQGVVVYLRSLVPSAQTGAANFGGMFTGGRDGGMGMRPEGGVPRDAAAGQ